MREGWNFHGDIAVPLERYSKSLIGANGTDADEIEAGKFIDTLLTILSTMYDFGEIREFIGSCRAYSGASAAEIPPSVAETLFTNFKLLVKNKSLVTKNEEENT